MKWNEKSRIHYGKKLNWNWFYRVKKNPVLNCHWIHNINFKTNETKLKTILKFNWKPLQNHVFFFFKGFSVSFSRSKTWRIFSWIIFLFGCFSGSKTNKNHHQFYLETKKNKLLVSYKYDFFFLEKNIEKKRFNG